MVSEVQSRLTRRSNKEFVDSRSFLRCLSLGKVGLPDPNVVAAGGEGLLEQVGCLAG